MSDFNPAGETPLESEEFKTDSEKIEGILQIISPLGIDKIIYMDTSFNLIKSRILISF